MGHIFHGICPQLICTLQSWQQTPWAHSAPAFRVQLLALQQGLVHSCNTGWAKWGHMQAGKSPNWERNKDLFFSAVTLLAFFQVAIATALPSVHHSGVWQIEETLPASRAQVALQLLPVALIKHPWKRVTGARWIKKHKNKKQKQNQQHVSDAVSDVFIWSGSLVKLYPVAAAMMQPPSSPLAGQQPSVSWVIPKLCPISWAMVAATPTADSEWSCWKWESKGIQKSAGNVLIGGGAHFNSRPLLDEIYFF